MIWLKWCPLGFSGRRVSMFPLVINKYLVGDDLSLVNISFLIVLSLTSILSTIE